MGQVKSTHSFADKTRVMVRPLSVELDWKSSSPWIHLGSVHVPHVQLRWAIEYPIRDGFESEIILAQVAFDPYGEASTYSAAEDGLRDDIPFS